MQSLGCVGAWVVQGFWAPLALQWRPKREPEPEPVRWGGCRQPAQGKPKKKGRPPALPEVVAKRGFSQSAKTYSEADAPADLELSERKVVLRRKGDEDLYTAESVRQRFVGVLSAAF